MAGVPTSPKPSGKQAIASDRKRRDRNKKRPRKKPLCCLDRSLFVGRICARLRLLASLLRRRLRSLAIAWFSDPLRSPATAGHGPSRG